MAAPTRRGSWATRREIWAVAVVTAALGSCRQLASAQGPTDFAQTWATPQHPPSGSPSCECIDPWAGMPAAVAREGIMSINSEQQQLAQFEPDYGATRCAAWDSAIAGLCVNADGSEIDSGQPTWCAKQWCFVNNSACERPHARSAIAWDDNTTALLPEGGLFYSHETCGNLDSFAKERHYQSLRGKNLRVSRAEEPRTAASALAWKRVGYDDTFLAIDHPSMSMTDFPCAHPQVSFPGDSDFGFDLFTDDHGFKQGSVVDLMREVAEDGEPTPD